MEPVLLSKPRTNGRACPSAPSGSYFWDSGPTRRSSCPLSRFSHLQPSRSEGSAHPPGTARPGRSRYHGTAGKRRACGTSPTAILAKSASKARGPLSGTEVRVAKALGRGKARISWLRPAWGDAEEVAPEETRLWGEAEKSSTWAPEQPEQWSLYSAMIEEDRGKKKNEAKAFYG